MSALLNEIQRILGDLQSGKAASRNKGIQQLDEKLSSCREDLDKLFLSKTSDISWTTIFEASKEALFKVPSHYR